VIAAPPESVDEVLALASELDSNLRRWVARRVAVVSTGGELLSREVRDTNLVAAQAELGRAGYEVESGGTVPDEDRAIAGRVARLIGDGFGLVVITGGVGAEDKDRTVEAIELLDPGLATSTLAAFTPGHGRHVKAEVRIAVATVGWGRVVCLPGPTREATIGLAALVEGLTVGLTDATLADRIGEAIRRANRTTFH
jgi:molybdopterin biosynthesis enzyme